MANAIKTAKQMFDQFLSKHDPDAVPTIGEPEATIGELASKGGHARAANLTPAKRHQIAKKAARTRWKSR
jgi:hypothetical protein